MAVQQQQPAGIRRECRVHAIGAVRALLEGAGGLGGAYPQATAALDALAGIGPGDAAAYEIPADPAPALPEGEYAARFTGEGHEVVHAADPRITNHGAQVLRQAVERGGPLRTPALTHLSRNPEKLYRMLDVLVGNAVTIVTSNVLLGPGRVAWRARPGD
jgi:hypothetical protein